MTLHPAPLMKPVARETTAVVIIAAFTVFLLCARPWDVLCAIFISSSQHLYYFHRSEDEDTEAQRV